MYHPTRPPRRGGCQRQLTGGVRLAASILTPSVAARHLPQGGRPDGSRLLLRKSCPRGKVRKINDRCSLGWGAAIFLFWGEGEIFALPFGKSARSKLLFEAIESGKGRAFKRSKTPTYTSYKKDIRTSIGNSWREYARAGAGEFGSFHWLGLSISFVLSSQ